MLNRVAKPFTNLVERYLPDPFVFVILLTLLSFIVASLFTPSTPTQVLAAWGGGFWNLLQFAMQMLLVLLTGYMLASTPVMRSILNKLATLANSPAKAIILVTLVSLLASWLNWGFGLVIGALFAKAIAKQTRVDYRLLVASAYSGFIVGKLACRFDCGFGDSVGDVVCGQYDERFWRYCEFDEFGGD